jgi:hypothetical protein
MVSQGDKQVFALYDDDQTDWKLAAHAAIDAVKAAIYQNGSDAKHTLNQLCITVQQSHLVDDNYIELYRCKGISHEQQSVLSLRLSFCRKSKTSCQQRYEPDVFILDNRDFDLLRDSFDAR